MHSRLFSALVLIGCATYARASTNAFTFFASVADSNNQADGLEGRVNGVDKWFPASPVEWFSSMLGPIWQTKAGWEQIAGGDDTAIVFEYNTTAPSPILDVALTTLGSFNEYDFFMTFSYLDAPAQRSLPRRNVAKRDFWDDATNYVPVPFTDRTIAGATDACTDTVTVVVVDANGHTETVTDLDTAIYTIPVDAAFPLQVTMTTLVNGNATAVLSDAIPISFATGPDGPNLVTSSVFRVVFCLSEGD
ncbi:hypothetical protein C8R45DRAFT_204595 [Mycena sanguinolenta]|nr:hypothetical protein C8R45DRAFT_204595 [Mycena sanguinolenta]